jgi:hypothetical protein
MESLVRFVEGGGWPMYPLILLGMVAAPASLALGGIGALAKSARPAGIFALVLLGVGAGAVGFGAFGQHQGVTMMEEALAHVNPEDAEIIRAAGRSEARGCMVLGLAVALLPLAAAAGLSLLALGKSRAGSRLSLVGIGALLVALGAGRLVGAAISSQMETRSAEEASAHVDVLDREAIRAMGAEAAAKALGSGFKLAAPLALAGIVLGGVGLARSRPAD